MAIVNRQGQIIQEDTDQDNFLRKLYSSLLGRCLLKILTLPFITKSSQIYMNSSLSKRKINKFIKDNHIQMDEYMKQDYTCFNAFFSRKIEMKYRPINDDKNVLIAPCDSKLTAYQIDENLYVQVKDTLYTLESLFNNKEIVNTYKNGYCLIFRLTVDDYHRYHYFDDGIELESKYIQGIFHTVNPVANDFYPIYKTNSREYTVLDTKHFGKCIMMEVGAMMVGKINNHHLHTFKRGEEKGYFEFGGSTIIVLVDKNVEIDKDILDNSMYNMETRVKLGERIGYKK